MQHTFSLLQNPQGIAHSAKISRLESQKKEEEQLYINPFSIASRGETEQEVTAEGFFKDTDSKK